MTTIGAKLLSLLTDSPADWEYAPAVLGARHGPTGVYVSKGAHGTVIVQTGVVVRSAALSDEDHLALYGPVAALIDGFKDRDAERHRAELARLLGLEGA